MLVGVLFQRAEERSSEQGFCMFLHRQVFEFQCAVVDRYEHERSEGAHSEVSYSLNYSRVLGSGARRQAECVDTVS